MASCVASMIWALLTPVSRRSNRDSLGAAVAADMVLDGCPVVVHPLLHWAKWNSPLPPVAIRSAWLQPRDWCEEFHERA
jgi:hypothetical protein